MIYVKVLLHASLDFKNEMISARKYIESNGKFTVLLPELTRYQHIRDEHGDDETFTKIKNRLTIQNISLVEQCDCLLIMNLNHRGIQNYIGGNSFLEMIIAFYLKKPIYLLNNIPEGMSYTEEIKSLYPIVIGDLDYFFNDISEDR